MLLDRAYFINFKSFGEGFNKFDIEHCITTIIGKNESGKTNVLQALKLFNHRSKLTKSELNKYKNLMNVDKNIDLKFEFLFDEYETGEFKSSDRTFFSLNDDGYWCFTGGLLNTINADDTICKIKNDLKELFNKAIFTKNTQPALNVLIKAINTFSNEILTNQKNIITEILSSIKKNYGVDVKQYKDCIDTLFERIAYFSSIIPMPFLFDESILIKDSFSLEEISKLKTNSINNNNKFLNLILKCFKLNAEELYKACATTTISAIRKTFQDNINTTLKEESQKTFQLLKLNEMYISFDFRDNVVDLYIYSNGTAVPLTERSNGLKWFLSLCLQLKRANKLASKSIILVDEPGQSVHIEAQKGIKDLFDQIKIKTQIIYTTHSPFMIDTEDLSKLVVIEKVEGFSKIHNKIHSAELEKSSKLETLSPLYQALGYSCKNNIGPSFNNDNIITEGITDYYYLLGFMYYCGIEKQNFPNIIPSISVDNIHSIASILIGWDCSFKILVDYDEGGYKQIKKFEKLCLEQSKDYFTVNGVPFTKIKPNKCDYITIEKILTEDKYQNVEENDKLLIAKEFYDNAKANNLELCLDSKNNIVNLLSQLNIYKE